MKPCKLAYLNNLGTIASAQVNLNMQLPVLHPKYYKKVHVEPA
jgi:hypothetical protein